MRPKSFISDTFLLNNQTAILLYTKYAKSEQIFDYHNHLSPKDIAEDRIFENITQAWIEGDHYKWRAMRAHGIDEKYITGDATDFEKFLKWAETVPYTMRNPLFHWSHMELKMYFGIDELLSSENAEQIYEKCNLLLNTPQFSVKNLLRRVNVKVIGTTDDPTDDLKYHLKLQEDNFEITVIPTFRPDRAVNIDNTTDFLSWLEKLEHCVGYSIINFDTFIQAIQSRHDFFHKVGCRISDHGHERYYDYSFNDLEVSLIFEKAKQGFLLTTHEINTYKSAMLYKLALMNHKKGWTQQFHIGAIRNNNCKMKDRIGRDMGFDSIGSPISAKSMSQFFDNLNTIDGLAKTIVYNSNPSESEMIASMIANFNESPIAGKMQYGAAWWFLDHRQGIENQLDIVSNYGLLAHFLGMVTDSRSFMSFSRHDYFRRILCNKLGQELEGGLLPDEIDLVGDLIKKICYSNAIQYINLSIHHYERKN